MTLWMFGGVTRIEGEAQAPRTQFWIAFSGPLTSLLLSAGPTANRVQRVLSATSSIQLFAPRPLVRWPAVAASVGAGEVQRLRMTVTSAQVVQHRA